MKHFAKQIKWTKNQLTRLTLLLSLTKPEHLLTLVLGDVDTLLQLGIRMQYARHVWAESMSKQHYRQGSLVSSAAKSLLEYCEGELSFYRVCVAIPYWWRQHRIAAGNGIAYADDKLGLLLQTSSGNRSLSR